MHSKSAFARHLVVQDKASHHHETCRRAPDERATVGPCQNRKSGAFHSPQRIAVCARSAALPHLQIFRWAHPPAPSHPQKIRPAFRHNGESHFPQAFRSNNCDDPNRYMRSQNLCINQFFARHEATLKRVIQQILCQFPRQSPESNVITHQRQQITRMAPSERSAGSCVMLQNELVD